jgi:hypothetical protein
MHSTGAELGSVRPAGSMAIAAAVVLGRIQIFIRSTLAAHV